MYTVVEPPLDFDTLNTRSKEHLQELLDRLTTPSNTFKLKSNIPLFQPGQVKDKIYIVKDGNLGYHYKNRTLFFYQDGDLIGLERDLDVLDAVVSSEFATVLIEYDANAFFAEINANPELSAMWREYLGRHIATLYAMTRSLFKDQEPVLPEVRSYEAGAEIIKEGSISTEVFTIADGIARIIKDGQPVGEVGADETFGALAAFTNTPRAASVIAVTDCLVLALPKDSFIELIVSRPQAVRRLMEDLATTIVNSGAAAVGGRIKL